MYEELVKALHEGAEFLEFSTPGIKNSFAKMCHNAADAIEDLEFACNRYEKDYKALCAYLSKWIPVTERLPKPETEVMVAFDDGEVWAVWQNWELYGDGENPFAYAKDAEWKAWHTVTHWMPLPEPPKEEYDGT